MSKTKNTRIRYHRIRPTMANDFRRWQWQIYRKDNTIGFATLPEESYTKIGALLKAKYLIKRNKRESLWRWI